MPFASMILELYVYLPQVQQGEAGNDGKIIKDSSFWEILLFLKFSKW
jgi:hypothetical protein